MATPCFLIELSKTSWRIHDSGSPRDQQSSPHSFESNDLVSQAGAIREALAEAAYAGQPVVLALDSSLCLCATLTGVSAQELRDPQAMAYRFEESIPWAAEEFVADSLACDNKALLVATSIDWTSGFVTELESAGIPIESIVPAALLAAIEHMRVEPWPSRHLALWQQDGWIDLVVCEQGRPVGWTWFSADAATLRQELVLQLLEAPAPMTLVAYDLPSELAEKFRDWQTEMPIELRFNTDHSRASLAATAAARLLQGQLEAPVELKRGPLGRTRTSAALRKHVGALQAAAGLLVVALLAALLYRGQALSRQADHINALQADVFHSVLPDKKLPVGVRNRMESELNQLKGLQGTDNELPQAVSVRTVLAGFLASLPEDRRFRLLEIRIEEGRLNLDGEVRKHSDAEWIAQRLRAEGFEVAAPRTQLLDAKRVSFRITGTYLGSSRTASMEKAS